MTRSLTGEVAFVTGAARGIGRAVVELFLAEGAAVAFCDVDEAEGRAAAADTGARFHTADVGSEAEVAAFVADAREWLGPPTVLVNNAGVNANFDAVEMSG